MTKLKIGFIGCGGIAFDKHLPAMARQQDVEMYAFCDIIESRAVEAAARTVGRDNVNDIVLLVSTASRRHAEVCCRDGVFLVIDRSANGTFVYDDQGKEHYVHQAELALTESGAICPGCPQEEPGCEALLYWIAE